MDVYDFDKPGIRPDRRKDSKIYRNKLIPMGPPLLQKNVVLCETDPLILSSIDSRSGELLQEKENYYSPFLKNDVYGLDNFGVPYSGNKKRRWQLMEMASNDIGSFQDPTKHCRVTVIRKTQDGSKHYSSMTNFVPSRGGGIFLLESVTLTELHTVSKDDIEIHKSAMHGPYKTLARKPNPPKRRKRKQLSNVQTDEQPTTTATSDTEAMDIPGWKRDAHIVYCETVQDLSKRLVNMNDKLKRCKDRSWETRGLKKRQKQLQSDAASELVNFTEVQNYSDEYCDNTDPFIVAESSTYTTNRETEYSLHTNLSEYLVYPKRSKKYKKRQTLPSSINTDLPKSLNSTKIVELCEEEENLETTLFSNSFPKLHSLSYSFEPRLVKRVPVNCVQTILESGEPIGGVYPLTLAAEVDQSSFEDEKCKLPEHFRGLLLVQKLKQKNKRIWVRCILNPNTAVQPHEFNEPTKRCTFNAEELAAKDVIAKFRCIRTNDIVERFISLKKAQLAPISAEEVPEEMICNNCFESCKFCVALRCKHFFCDSCWIAYIKLSVNAGQLPVTCMDLDCDLVMNKEQMLVLLPYAYCDRYEMLTKQNLTQNKLAKYKCFQCFSCQEFLEFNLLDAQKLMVQCECGSFICLRCLNEAHFPLSCADAESYKKTIRSSTILTSLKPITVLVQECPHCGKYCEKTEGCDHIVCSCTKEFCYNCGSPWASYGSHPDCLRDLKHIELIDASPRSMISQSVYEKRLYFYTQKRTCYSENFHGRLKRNNLSKEQMMYLQCITNLAFQTLELCCVQIYLGKNKLRRMKKGTDAEHLGINIGLLSNCYEKLRIQATRFQQYSQYKPSNRKSELLLEAGKKIDNTINELICLCKQRAIVA